MDTTTSKIVEMPALLAWREDCRAAGRRVVWTNGCFDLLHAGHVRCLAAAARLGDALVVGINSDESVRRLKGASRPLVPQTERAELLASLVWVERVVVFDELSPEAVLARLRPDVHCKGADYAPPHGKPIPEQALVESYGGCVAFLPLMPGLSTTTLVDRIQGLFEVGTVPSRMGQDPAPVEETKAVACLLHREVSEMDAVIVARMEGRRVLVIGDVMLDEYVRGSVRRLSQEAPVPVVELERHDHGPGGAANAAANVASLKADVSLVGLVGEDEAGRRLRGTLEGSGVRPLLLSTPLRPTTTKTRVIAQNQQVVRIDRELRSSVTGELEQHLIRAIEGPLADAEACLLSDYEKGAVTNAVARQALAQAGRRGVPTVVDPKGPDPRKYQGAFLVKPNHQEAQELLGRTLDTEEAIIQAGRQLLELMESHAVLLTRGAAGMVLFVRGAAPLRVPALAREVFDVTGAGDTAAAVVTVALAVGASLELAAHLASRAAAAVVARLGAVPARPEDLLPGRDEP